MYELTMFPASDGDSLLLSYGEAAHSNHVLVDGGRTGDYARLRQRLAAIGQAGQKLELLVLSHIDADHIEGFLSLAKDPALPVEVAEVWYNGFDQLIKVRPQGPRQGDLFSDAIKQRGWKANQRFGGGAIDLGAGKQPHSVTLPGGLQITFVSPDSGRLDQLHEAWNDWRTAEAAKAKEAERKRRQAQGLQSMGRKPMPAVLDIDHLADGAKEPIDDEPPNGSSIAFIAAWDGKRVLLSGDAHPDLLEEVLAPMAATEGGRYRVDVFKVSHHGSIGNTTRKLIGLLDCKRFAVSTNGTRHGHPDPETIAKVIKYAPKGKKTLYFNYRQERTTPWNNPALNAGGLDFECVYAPGLNGEITIAI